MASRRLPTIQTTSGKQDSRLRSTRPEDGLSDASSSRKSATSKVSPLPFYNYEQIIRLLNSHESFNVRSGCDLEGLPKYYDLVPYNASPDQEKELWKAEVHRLIDVVNSGVPHHLQGEDAWFGAADADGYALLNRLTLQLRHAWLVSILDNELIMLEHAPDLSDKDLIIKLERSLRREYDADNQVLRYKRPLKLDHFNDKCYHALINHVTANVAQMLARTARGRFWDEYFIATLAKLSAKLKWLADDLPRAVSTVISTKDEIVDKLTDEGRLPLPNAHHGRKTGEAHDENVNGSGNRYFVVHGIFHQLFSHLFEVVMDQLESDEETGIAPNVFETSVVWYDTGYWGDRAMLCGLRDGGIGGLGNKNAVSAGQASIELCGALFDEVKSESPPPTAPPTSEKASEHGEHAAPSSTTIYWHWVELDGIADTETGGRTMDKPLLRGRPSFWGQRRLYRMKSVIDVLVPYQMLSPAFHGALEDKLIEISTLAPTRDNVRKVPERRWVGTCLIQTSEFQAALVMEPLDKDTCRVWETRSAQDRGLAPRKGMVPRLIRIEEELHKIEEEWEAKIKQVKDSYKMLTNWAVGSKSIMIRYKPYAWGTLTVAAILVTGGVLFGFLVGKRIEPVDPFNVTIFFWGFAAFLILVCKSYKVKQWDWRDFLLGNIVCRSTSEIVGVTGIKDQNFLALLLRVAGATGLEMTGPYHTIFTRKSESDDGFAIDLALHTQSMADGGTFFIKVDSLLGPALVSLRLGPWKLYDCVYAKGSKEDEGDAICRDFNDRWKLTQNGRSLNLRVLCTNALKWHRVVGVYDEDCWFD
jgi:hypothetical protein